MGFNQLETIGIAFLSGLRVAELAEEVKAEKESDLEENKCKKCKKCGEHKAERKECKFKIGDKVKVIEVGTAMMGFKVGDTCTVSKIYDSTAHEYEIRNDEEIYGYANENQIDRINESEDN